MAPPDEDIRPHLRAEFHFGWPKTPERPSPRMDMRVWEFPDDRSASAFIGGFPFTLTSWMDQTSDMYPRDARARYVARWFIQLERDEQEREIIGLIDHLAREVIARSKAIEQEKHPPAEEEK